MSSDHRETGVDPEQSDQDSQTRVVAHRSVEYQGPLPPPSALSAYDQISPGAADRMIREWQQDRQHQRKMQAESLEIYKNSSRWAPAYRLVTIIVVIAGGLLAVLLGEPAMGWFLGLGAALSYPVGSALIRILRGRDNEAQSDHSTDS